MTTIKNIKSGIWTETEQNVLRFSFLYFVIQSLPLSAEFTKTFFSINWLKISYGDIFLITRFSPDFTPGPDNFLNWLIVAILAVAGSFIWKKYQPTADCDILYYWLRTIVRYRLAIGIIGYGFIKFFPLQSPFPSISNLNTAYGDFTDWKIFSMSLGIVPSYELFLGGVELLAGILLLFRRTATIGAVIILIFTGNVVISNLAYDGGEFVYAFYLISFALLVLFFDAQRIYRLVSLEKPTEPNTFRPRFAGRQKTIRYALKGLVLFFFVFLYGFKTYSGYKKDIYQFPKTKGLSKSSGIYNVSEFRINGRELPYSVTDLVRWKDVVFEKWATISIRSNRPVILDSANVEQVFKNDADRNYELAGSGGRHYYSYKADTVNHTLTLENKNRHYAGEKLVLTYTRPTDSTFVLSGLDQNRDSVYVVLNKINKRYPLKEGRRRTLKL